MNLLIYLTRSAKTETSGNRDVVYVVNDKDSVSDADLSVANHLSSNGYNINYYTDSEVTEDDTELRELVIVGSDVMSSSLDGLFKDTDIPLLCLQPQETNKHELSSNAQVTSGSYSQISVVQNSHPITSGLSLGAYTVQSSRPVQVAYTIGAGATVLAKPQGAASANSLVVYDVGDLLEDGTSSVSRRAFTWVCNSNADFLTPNGYSLILSTCEWLLGFK